VREIIDHDQIVLAARNTTDSRSPHIKVNKIKSMHRTIRGGRKRKLNMATQPARMVEMLIRRPSARKMGTMAEPSQSVTTGVTKRCHVVEGVVVKAVDTECGADEVGRQRV
jgi:hypothetical protein